PACSVECRNHPLSRSPSRARTLPGLEQIAIRFRSAAVGGRKSLKEDAIGTLKTAVWLKSPTAVGRGITYLIPPRSARIRSSVGGWLLKSDARPPPANGLTMNMWWVAGLASGGK